MEENVQSEAEVSNDEKAQPEFDRRCSICNTPYYSRDRHVCES